MAKVMRHNSCDYVILHGKAEEVLQLKVNSQTVDYEFIKRETILGGPTHQVESFQKGWEFQAERSSCSREESNSDDVNCLGTKLCGKELWGPLGAEKSYWLTISKKVGTSVLESHATEF